MAQVLWFLLPAATVISHLVHVATGAGSTVAPSPPLPDPRPACPDNCGDVDIPYPWGIGDNCSWRGMYSLTCNHSFNPPRPYLGNTEVVNISLESGEIRVRTLVSSLCYSSKFKYYSVNTTLDLTGLLISATRNEFTAIGCNTLALLKGSSYYSGCITSCESLDVDAQDDDKCTGLGCCQTPIPRNLSDIAVDWDTNRTKGIGNPVWWFSPCSYAFVAEKDWYHFEHEDLARNSTSFATKIGNRTVTEVPLVLDWAIRNNGSCHPPTEKNGMLEELTASACVSANSNCVNTSHVIGYLCNCSKGYTGNPYVSGGCTDMNECELQESPCASGSTCYNTPGNYTCKCNFGRRGDGKSDEGCQPIFPGYAIAIVATFVASILSCFAIMELKKRKQRRFFEKNGGQILKSVGINFFTERQLKKMTNHYKTPIGEGAFGKVFMGTTMDSAQRVAVKRSIAKGSALPQEEFVNEITFQFRISHSNVVRLIGCCLETDVPMLVFEFVSNGSLHNVLHGADSTSRALPLPKRLDIAIGSAEALSYMHSTGGHTNHVHGDIKSGNILLDDNLTPKVSDFGSSKLVSIASKYAKWCVSGDMNYIDPMYIKTGRFTEKSDVYSFGVVLLELITRKTPKYNGENSLPLDFVKYFKEEGRRRELYDRDILSDDDASRLDSIGALAVRCLKDDLDERPTMAEVAKELKQVKLIAFGSEGHVAKRVESTQME